MVAATAMGTLHLGAQIHGLENLKRSVIRRPQDGKKVIELSTRVVMRFDRPVLQGRLIPVASIGDVAAASDLVCRWRFVEFALLHLQMLVTDAESQGVYTLPHVCRDSSDKVNLLVRTRVDWMSIDHEVYICQARDLFRGRACVAAYVDPVRILPEGTPADVAAACRDSLVLASSPPHPA